MSGILEFHQDEILVRCRPSNLPKSLVLDISTLELGGSLQLKDIQQIDGVEFVGDADTNIITHVLVVQVVVQEHQMMRMKLRMLPEETASSDEGGSAEAENTDEK